jgi:hypothetical protein
MKHFGKIIIILIANFLLAGLLTVACAATDFLLGGAASGNHNTELWTVYCGYIILHSILNLSLITKPKKNSLFIVLASCLFILIFYGLIWLFFKGEIFGYYDAG